MPNMTKGKHWPDYWMYGKCNPSELMAFGDANNDKDMLELAKYSYVMKNSQDKTLFDIAYDVAPSNDDQGVLTTIENVVLNLK